ncbi:16S rRNA (cytosine(967)-C(5))-methyltransferase RsmB [Pelomonas sp. CA6]|uniref:16S rRNA (cytosine(967)-C(5))-methyltransferase RsmB n=1 Tax=Pelomonas sp. CA6 TaxID=2907999 RepID=UPI0035A95BF6
MSASPSPLAPARAPSLARLLLQTAQAVQAVRAGRSLTEWLAQCPGELRPGVQALSFTVLRRLGAAQALRRRLAPRNPPPAVDNLLLCALALLWPEDAPAYAPHTVVNQAVAAVRERAAPSSAFVNAVLRRFLREQQALLAELRQDPVALYNHPSWWVDMLRRDWGELAPALLAANNERAPMTLRVNRLGPASEPTAGHDRRADYQARLAAQGLPSQAPPLPLLDQALVLDHPVPVQELPDFASGAASVQDAAAQLAAPLLIGGPGTPWPMLPAGARVLDACAAPGGKTAHLQELAGNRLDLLALDADEKRLQRVRENLARLRLDAQVRAADAGDTAAWWDGRPFDAILLDAPCSASGIVRRHPDVRWLRRDSDIAALARTQARLLDALWLLLKPGGRLVYATCSVFKDEGEHQTDAFLQRHADAKRLELPGCTGHLLPLADNGPSSVPALDGFYYALLHKA